MSVPKPSIGVPVPCVSDSTPLVDLRMVSKRFHKKPDMAHRLAIKMNLAKVPPTVHAVDRASIHINPGEVVGLVGESGCGKSTLGRLAVGLHGLSEGRRFWRGKDIDQMDAPEKKQTGLKMQMVFQDPYASLNPRMRVNDIVGEAAVAHGLVAARDQQGFVAQLLQRVGLEPSVANRFPHQFSGGQRARIGIARALALQSEFLVCDEAVAALDVSIQAQVINLFMQLREELRLAYLFISHDLSVVRHISDRVVIMYLGRVVEMADSVTLFERPNHPYSQALLAEVPTLAVSKRTFVAIRGEIPSPLHPPSGCHFHPRCPHAMERCRVEAPVLRAIGAEHQSACHLNDA
ncbi:MAG: oligopeptide/dipeptide ABC transporter ATP-binding protein [Rhizobacter sp.]